MMFVLLIMIILNLTIVGSSNRVYATDTYGHLGGALTGLIWGLAFFPRVKNPQSMKLKKIGRIIVISYFFLFTLLLFLN